jgi:hypothetical protein
VGEACQGRNSRRLGNGTSHLPIAAPLDITTAVLAPRVMDTIIATPAFLRDIADPGLSEAALSEIVDYMARHPMAGDLIPRTGGVR